MRVPSSPPGASRAEDPDAFAAVVTDDFQYTAGEEQADADLFLETRTALVVNDQDTDGLTVTGIVLHNDSARPVQLDFTPRDGRLAKLTITDSVDLPDSFWDEAVTELNRRQSGSKVQDSTTLAGGDNAHPAGTLRREGLGVGRLAAREPPHGR